MRLFDDPLHDEFASWPLGLLEAAGGAVGEVVALAGAMADADDETFIAGWSDAADRHVHDGDAAERAGRRVHAAGRYLRATSYYEVAIHMLYGAPVAPRLAELFDRLTDAFGRAMALRSPAGERLSIPYGAHQLPGWFLRADDAVVGERRPVIICTNGYDATMADMYLAQAIDATRRGYHCVLFDGPGQGAVLVHEGLAMVPDWENVVRPVVDTVLARTDVDPARVVLQGWSLGGHLAARAATGESRLAAVVLDPPGWGLMAGVPAFLSHLGLSEGAVAALPALSDADEATVMAAIEADRSLRWDVVARDLWVNGAADLRDYLRLAAAFTLDGRVDGIRCPVIATKAEADPLAAGADAFVARLTAPTTFLRFSVVEGAGDHCELQSRWLANQRILDALDTVLGR